MTLLITLNFKEVIFRTKNFTTNYMQIIKEKQRLKADTKFRKLFLRGIYIAEDLPKLRRALELLKINCSLKQNCSSIQFLSANGKNPSLKIQSILYVNNVADFLDEALLNARFIFITNLEQITSLEKCGIHYSKIFYIDESNEISYVYSLTRFLLSFDFITFDEFIFHNKGHNPFLANNFICLSLPETPERMNSFKEMLLELQIITQVTIFHGLRHSLGWIGCGLSFKYLFTKALEYNFQSLTICEDDIIFCHDFDRRMKTIYSYLSNNNPEYEIFAGGITELPGLSNLKDFISFENESLVKIEHIIGMWFSIYHKNMYQLLANWDYNDRDKTFNQIDYYLSKKVKHVLLPIKFLASFKVNINSLTSGIKNVQEFYQWEIMQMQKKLHLKYSKL